MVGWLSWIIWVGPNAIADKSGAGGDLRNRRGESSATTEAEIRVIQIQAKESVETRLGEDQILPKSLWRGPADTLILDH